MFAVSEDVAGCRLLTSDGHGTEREDQATKPANLTWQLLLEQLQQHLQQACCKKKAGTPVFTALDERLCSCLLEEDGGDNCDVRHVFQHRHMHGPGERHRDKLSLSITLMQKTAK